MGDHIRYKIFSHLPLNLDVDELCIRLRIKKHDATLLKCLKFLINEATEIGVPKGLYKIAYIEERGKDFIVVDGIRLQSTVLRKNVKESNRVFIFLATCGKELADWGVTKKEDLLESFIADAIQEAACRIACDQIFEAIDYEYKLKNPSMMNPGSLSDWPLEQQKPLFEILEQQNAKIGINLHESFLMQPVKSVSGIRFPSETGFQNCELCPREKCSRRIVPCNKK